MLLDLHLTLIIAGLLLGGIYAMISFGLTLTFGISRILNVAHGDFLVLGSVMGLMLVFNIGLNPFATLLVIVPFFFLIGMAFERGLIRTILKQSPEKALATSIVVTAGLSMAIEDSTSFFLGQSGGYFGGLGYISIPYNLPPINIAGFYIPTIRLLSLIFIIIIAVLLYLLISKTYFGKIIRATIQDRETAMILGANVNRISTITLGLGISLAAVSGLFFAMITSFSPFAGLGLTVKALTIVVLGGLGSLIGSLVGGLIIGLIESYVSFYIGTEWAPTASILILILILLVKPSGLFGKRESRIG